MTQQKPLVAMTKHLATTPATATTPVATPPTTAQRRRQLRHRLLLLAATTPALATTPAPATTVAAPATTARVTVATPPTTALHLDRHQCLHRRLLRHQHPPHQHLRRHQNLPHQRLHHLKQRLFGDSRRTMLNLIFLHLTFPWLASLRIQQRERNFKANVPNSRRDHQFRRKAREILVFSPTRPRVRSQLRTSALHFAILMGRANRHHTLRRNGHAILGSV